MASQNRTITMTLNAETNGSEKVRDLAKEIALLGKKGGEAAPEFERLSKELNALAEQQDSVSTFNALTNAVTDSKNALEAARVAAQQEKQELTSLQQVLTTAKLAEEAHAVGVRESTATLTQARQGYLESRAAISAYLATIGGAKTANREQREELKVLNQSLRESKAAYDGAKAAVSALTPEYDRLKTASNEAAAGVKTQERELNRVNATVATATTEYDQYGQALTQADAALKKLGVDTSNIVGEQNRLVQSMNRLTAEAGQLKTGLANAGNAALTSAQKIEQAFSGMGVKSVRDLKSEIASLQAAMMKLAQDPSISNKELAGAMAMAKAKVAELNTEMNRGVRATQSFGESFTSAMKQFGPATLVFNGVSAAISAIFTAGQKIPQVTAEFQSLERALKILTGSSAQAKKEFEFITAVSNRTGQGIAELAKGYLGVTAAAKGTSMEGAKSRMIFESIAGAMGALGRSSADTELALQAVTQMMSKGVVSQEEMRQQLGERLPGALKATSEELGVTTADLNDLIATGKLAADDVLPAMARGLDALYKTGQQNDTLIGKWNQFTNALKLSAAAVGNSGLLEGLLKLLRVGAAIPVVLGEGFISVGKSIGLLAAGIRTGDLAGALRDISAEFKAVDERAGAIAGRANKTEKSITDLAREAKNAGQEFVTMADGTQMATETILGADDGFLKFLVSSMKATKSAEDYATSARKAAEYTRSAGEASITAANALGSEADKRAAATKVANDNATALGSLYTAENKVLEVMKAEAMERAIALRDGKATSDQHVKELNNLGDEIGKREVVVQGIHNQVEAQRLLASAMQTEAEANLNNANRVDNLRASYVAIQEAIISLQGAQSIGIATQQQVDAATEEGRRVRKLYADAVKDEGIAIQAIAKLSGDEKVAKDALIVTTERHLKLLKDMGETRTDEYAKTALQLEQAKLERQVLDDNSNSLEKLKGAYLSTKAAVEELKRQQAAGIDVTQKMAAANLEAARASALYTDALKDQIAKVEALKQKKLATIDLDKSEISLTIARLQSSREIALATGDEEKAAKALVQIKKLEVELAKLNAEAKKAEAEASRLVSLAKIEEIKKTGEMTEAKRAEIAALEASAKAKQIEAEIAGITAAKLGELAKISEEAGGSASSAAGEYDKLTSSLDNVARSAGKAGRALKGAQYDAEGFALNSEGQRVAVAGGKASWADWSTEELDNLLAGRAGIVANGETLAAARDELKRRSEDQAQEYGALVQAQKDERTKASGVMTADQMTQAANTGRAGFSMPTYQQPAQAATPAKAMTVNISLAGKNTPVVVASQQDAFALSSILKQLESEAMRSF